MRSTLMLYGLCAGVLWCVLAHGEKLPENTVLARVNGSDISEAEYQDLMKDLPKQINALPENIVRKVALDQLINTKVVLQAAEKYKVEDDPETRRRLGYARERVLIEQYLKKTGDDDLTEGDLKKAYTDYKKENPPQQVVKTRQILVKSEDTAKDIISQLQNGADFVQLAKKYNLDESYKISGGETGYLAKNEAAPEYTEAAFALKKGEYTQTPVKTPLGWHVIKLEDRKQRPTPGFEEVKNSLRDHALEEIMQKRVATLRSKAKVDILYHSPEEQKTDAQSEKNSSDPSSAAKDK